jgi:hypothetical protein
VPTVLTTGRTGCTSSNESVELVRRAVGEGAGWGLSRGSEVGVVVVDFVVVLPVRRGLVDWAWSTEAESRNTAPRLKKR